MFELWERAASRPAGTGGPLVRGRARRPALPRTVARKLAPTVLILGTVWAFLVATTARAHPIHRSIAEADYNRATGTLEVALRVFADDFQDALSAHAKKKISLEKTPAGELEEVIRGYLSAYFTVKNRDGVTASQRWVGRKLKDAENELWLYFEVPLPDGLEGVKIHHAMLSEHFRDQLNSVLVRDGPRKVTLVFLPNHREKTVRFAP